MKELFEKSYIIIDGKKIDFYIYRKKIKNMNLRVDKDKKIIISIPMRMSSEKAKAFVKEKINWINKQMTVMDSLKSNEEDKEIKNGNIVYILGEKYKLVILQGKVNNIIKQDKTIQIIVKEKYLNNIDYLQKMYDNWLKEFELDVLNKLVHKYKEKLLDKYNIKYPEINVRKMKSRWGCCFPFKNKVVFNLSLIKTPIDCVEYVVIHELSHFKYRNHSKDFYNFVAIYMPNWKEKRKVLNKEYFNI